MEQLQNNRYLSIKKYIALALYYGFARWLPSYGFLSGKGIRRFLCKRIFRYCGKEVNIERNAYFGSGKNIELGDYSGIGINAVIPSDTIIGKYVMMGPNCYILSENHRFDNINKPMMLQGSTIAKPTVIEDDVWIGRDVLMTPSRHISKGSIIAARCVLTKDFPDYSIVGGNPSKLIRMRNNE